MIVENISHHDHPWPRTRSVRTRQRADDRVPEAPQSDSQPLEDADRRRLLGSIRKKMRNGYYNSDAVLEDLSHSFAGVFEKLL